MPTFNDPLGDAEEARQALRALAHATQSFASPSQTYGVIGELLGGLRSLHQVLGQVASAHTRHEEFAVTDDGEHWTGVEEAFAAARGLERAARLVARAELAVDQASQHSGRIAWDTTAFRPIVPVSDRLAPRFGPSDPFARPDHAAEKSQGMSL